jgi:hypothetical protein
MREIVCVLSLNMQQRFICKYIVLMETNHAWIAVNIWFVIRLILWRQSYDIMLTFILLMWRIGRASNSIPMYPYIQQDATSHSLFISGNCSTCFGWYFHPSPLCWSSYIMSNMCAEHNYIFSHRIVHWVYNYMWGIQLHVAWTKSRLTDEISFPQSTPRTYCIAAC